MSEPHSYSIIWVGILIGWVASYIWSQRQVYLRADFRGLLGTINKRQAVKSASYDDIDHVTLAALGARETTERLKLLSGFIRRPLSPRNDDISAILQALSNIPDFVSENDEPTLPKLSLPQSNSIVDATEEYTKDVEFPESPEVLRRALEQRQALALLDEEEPQQLFDEHVTDEQLVLKIVHDSSPKRYNRSFSSAARPLFAAPLEDIISQHTDILPDNDDIAFHDNIQYATPVYADGTELDHIDDLPVGPMNTTTNNTSKNRRHNSQNSTLKQPPPFDLSFKWRGESRSKSNSYSFPPTHVAYEAVKLLRNPTRQPILLRHINGTKVPVHLKKMRYNPDECRWEGNEQCLSAFNGQEPQEDEEEEEEEEEKRRVFPFLESPRKRPALIKNMGFKGPQVIGSMSFDFIQLRWEGNETDLDVFADIEDLQDTREVVEPKWFKLSAHEKNLMSLSERMYRNMTDGMIIEKEKIEDLFLIRQICK